MRIGVKQTIHTYNPSRATRRLHMQNTLAITHKTG